MGIVIFDLDGTLVDSAPDIRAAANLVLKQQGADPLDLDETKRFIGDGTAVFVERMIAARGLDPGAQAAMLKAFLASYEDAVHLSTLFPGVRTCLDALKRRALGVCTNKPAGPTRALLDHFDLTRRFGAIVSGDSLPRKKPDPAPLLACVDALGGGAAMMVGDSEVDAETAARAGLPFALFTGGYRRGPLNELPHDAAFRDFADLPRIVTDLLG